jgi:glutathione S-transferase
MYDINETTAAADAERLRVAFGRLDEILARGPYLLGDRFTRADLTLAALTAPILATVGTSDTLAGQGALPSHHPRSRPVSYGRGTVWTTMGSVPVASVTTNTW